MSGGDLAIVAGATGGLGPAVVDHFAARGDRVVAVARSAGDVGDLEHEYGHQVRGEALDLTDPGAVEAFWTGLGETPKWLANLAGGYAGGSVEEAEPASVRGLFDLNLLTAWWMCRAAVPRMKGGGGAIVNVAARDGLVGGAGKAAYAVSKAAVAKLTEVLAQEMQGQGLRVNAIAPAVIDTDSNRASLGPKTMAKAVSPADIAEVIGYLCSDASKPVTGSIVPVYGAFELPR